MNALKVLLCILLILLLTAAILLALNRWQLRIELRGDAEYTLECGEPYREEGAEAVFGGMLFLREAAHPQVRIRGEVDTAKPGTYLVIYSASYRWFSAHRTRTVHVTDTAPPEIRLQETPDSRTLPGAAYQEEGYSAWDNADGDITDRVERWEENGTVFYRVTDSSGNTAEAERRIRYFDPVPPDPAGYVYLTFDDGPGRYTRTLLDILDKYGVKVTFFVVDTGYADLIGEEAAAGHSVGVHSATHDYRAIYASEEAFFADLQKMNDVIRAQTGSFSEIIRFPGGSSNTISSFNPGIMSRLVQEVTERGYRYFDWNVSSGDAGETTDPEEISRNVIDGISRHETSVVLLHDSHSYTVEAVERILVWCLENRYALLPLDKDSPAAHHRVNN